MRPVAEQAAGWPAVPSVPSDPSSPVSRTSVPVKLAARPVPGKLDPASAHTPPAARLHSGRSTVYGTTFGHPVGSRSATLATTSMLSQYSRRSNWLDPGSSRRVTPSSSQERTTYFLCCKLPAPYIVQSAVSECNLNRGRQVFYMNGRYRSMIGNITQSLDLTRLPVFALPYSPQAAWAGARPCCVSARTTSLPAQEELRWI